MPENTPPEATPPDPTRMHAWRVTRLGPPAEALEQAEVDVPAPGPGQVLVRVDAAALNFADTLMCAGTYQVRPELPFTPGMEFCGHVVAHGPQVGPDAPAVGTRVVGPAALPSGGFAPYALADATTVHPAPDSLDDARAAALWIAYQTAWFGLHRRAGLQEGETLLVHAAAGGVGSAAVQLGKAAGARVIGVVGGADKAALARELGCDLVLDRRTDDIVAAVKEATGGRGADVVYDPVGGSAFTASTKCIAFEGRIVVVGFASGDIPTARVNHALVKNYSILGLHWGLYVSARPDLVARAHAGICALADAGHVAPHVTDTIPFDDLPGALERLGGGSTVGRLVLIPRPDQESA